VGQEKRTMGQEKRTMGQGIRTMGQEKRTMGQETPLYLPGSTISAVAPAMRHLVSWVVRTGERCFSTGDIQLDRTGLVETYQVPAAIEAV
jgi:hypothetical protein